MDLLFGLFIIGFTSYGLTMIYFGIHSWRTIAYDYILSLNPAVILFLESCCMYAGYFFIRSYIKGSKKSKNAERLAEAQILSTPLGNNIFSMFSGIILYIGLLLIAATVKNLIYKYTG